MTPRVIRLLVVGTLALSSLPARAQTVPGISTPPAAAAQPAPQDPLGRSTPRGTVFGFLGAARRGDDDLARQYLQVKASDAAAATLTHQLFVVLDTRLPPRLSLLSDAPEGSRANPLAPDEEHVGTIQGAAGPVAIVVERVRRPNGDPIWLFPARTLDGIPDLYDEIAHSRRTSFLSRLYLTRRIGATRVIDWVAIIIGLPIIYLLTSRLNRMLTPIAARASRRAGRPADKVSNALPLPARILVVTLVGYWLLSMLPLSLLVRQVLANTSRLLFIASLTWLAILANGAIEQLIHRRLASSNAAAMSIVRVGRRTVDAIWLAIALIATLRYFGVDPTPILAGLGVGGIAVALAAQKTLENVIAGASLILDKAVREGDTLKIGEIVGTVEHVGLRSTRIRTLDRTVVTLPNSQVASMSLETLSVRDKFRCLHVVGMRYETTPAQLRAVIDGIDRLLQENPLVERESIRVRFLRLGAFSLDVEVFAYIFATDWNRFLEVQETLLFAITGIVETAGAQIAFPSQTMYVENTVNSQLPNSTTPK